MKKMQVPLQWNVRQCRAVHSSEILKCHSLRPPHMQILISGVPALQGGSGGAGGKGRFCHVGVPQHRCCGGGCGRHQVAILSICASHGSEIIPSNTAPSSSMAFFTLTCRNFSAASMVAANSRCICGGLSAELLLSMALATLGRMAFTCGAYKDDYFRVQDAAPACGCHGGAIIWPGCAKSK